MINGSILDKTFQGNDKVESANTEKKKATYMYKDEENVNLMDNETYEQFTLSLNQVGDKQKFLKEGTDVDILYFPLILSLDLNFRIENPGG